MSAFKLFFFSAPHTPYTRAHALTRTHTVIPDFTAGSLSVMHLYHPPPFTQQRTERQSFNVNLHKLFNSTTRVGKSRGCALIRRQLRLCFSRLTLFLNLLLLLLSAAAPSAFRFPPQLQATQILTVVKILSRGMRPRFQSQIIPPAKKASVFLLRCCASLRAFLDAGAFE